MAATKLFQLSFSFAICLIPPERCPEALISKSNCILHVWAGLPTRLWPWGFQSMTILVMSSGDFLIVCPIQSHFRLRISV